MWLYVPSPASSCSAEPACSASDSPAPLPDSVSAIAQCATLNGKLSPPASWRRAWTRATWIKRLSGLMSQPSTLQRGVDAWIASLPVSRVKTCPLLAVAPDWMASAAAYSTKSCASPAIAVRDSCFWRTSQASLLPPPPLWTKPRAGLKNAPPPVSWGNWPIAGGMRNGCIYERPTWVPPTAESAGSALLGTWLTPHGMSGMDSTGRLGAGGEFAKQATNWATPRATDGEKGGPHCRGGRGDPILAGQAVQWATPNAHDGRRPGTDLKSTQGANLNRDAATWVTPTSRMWRGGGAGSDACGRQDPHGHAGLAGGALGEFAPSPDDPRWQRILAERPDLAPAVDGKLNPRFAAWLMGWPPEWCEVNGRENRQGQLRCIGNGVVPQQAEAAFVELIGRALC